MSMTPEQRRIRAQIAAHTRWSRVADRSAATAPARKAAETRWERHVDPDGVLPVAERRKRARSAQMAYMAQMRLARTRKT